MKKILGVMAVMLLVSPIVSIYAETSTDEVQSSELLTEYNGVPVAEYLQSSYLDVKTELFDRAQTYTEAYLEYIETPEYEKLLEEDPSVEAFGGMMNYMFKEVRNGVDKIYLIHTKSYQEELASIKVDYENKSLELTTELINYISLSTSKSSNKIQSTDYSQEDLLTLWNEYTYYTEAMKQSLQLQELVTKHVGNLEDLPEDQRSYSANKGKLEALFKEYVQGVEFVDEISSEDIKTIEQTVESARAYFDRLESQPIAESVRAHGMGSYDFGDFETSNE